MTTPLIMLVDDSELDIFISKRIIKISNLTERIITFKNGAAALAYLAENTACPQNLPDFIFLDLNMPIMNGAEFISQFEKLPESAKEKSKVIILSSSEDIEDITNIKDNKYIVKYLTKPLLEEDLNLNIITPGQRHSA